MSKAKRSNPLSLAVLVLLCERPMHPYEMASTLRQRRKENSIKLNYGSLYTVIELLIRAGFIRAQRTLREGRRPEKTIYELTPPGEYEMTEWLRELIGIPAKEYPRFEAGLSLLPALEPEEAIPLLEERAGRLKQQLELIREGFAKCREIKLPRLFSIETEYHEAITRAECQYVEKLIHDLRTDRDELKKKWIEVRTANLAQKQSAAGKKPKKKKE